MSSVPLTPLIGTNPLGFLAALGVLDILTRGHPDRRITLSWKGTLRPYPVIGGPEDLDEIVQLVVTDLDRWAASSVLMWGPEGQPLDDLKPSPANLRRWAGEVAAAAEPDARADSDLFCALVAEGAQANKGDAKPTHLHFTAGQQRFLTMVRDLRAGVSESHIREAVEGPWRGHSSLPVLGWNAGGERLYAVRATDPAKDKKTGDPGADWLAFLGLRFLPVSARPGAARDQLATAGCEGNWKEGSFVWPLWEADATAPVVASLLAVAPFRTAGAPSGRLGVTQVLAAPIRRSDQGGYGSFGAASWAEPRSAAGAAVRVSRPRPGMR